MYRPNVPEQVGSMKFNGKLAISVLCGLAATVSLACSPVVADDQSTPPPALRASMPDPEAGETSQPIHTALPSSSPNHHHKNKLEKDKPADKDEPAEVQFKSSAPPAIPTVTYGTPNWAIRPRVASSLPAAPAAPSAAPTGPQIVPVAGNSQVELERRLPENDKATVNIRIVKHYHLPPDDTVMAYPWPVRPPKPIIHSKLQEKPHELKALILASGYSTRIDVTRPHPLYGWRWVHAFQAAHEKSGLGYPHTMLTMYPWVNKMTPYVVAEVKRVNAIEVDRLNEYKKVQDEYDRLHEEMENEAAAKGLVPVAIKVNRHGIGQTQLPPGNWWISATRKLPDIKFYWQVPITVGAGQTTNVQLTNLNAIVVQGGW